MIMKIDEKKDEELPMNITTRFVIQNPGVHEADREPGILSETAERIITHR